MSSSPASPGLHQDIAEGNVRKFVRMSWRDRRDKLPFSSSLVPCGSPVLAEQVM